MFSDKAKITIKAGDGGSGAVSFQRLKCAPNGGPDGGSGGRGGSIIFIADENSSTLSDFYYTKRYFADNGEKGQPKNCYGKAGKDLFVSVPPGTVIKDFETGNIIADLFKTGDTVTVLEGGKGGKGNSSFCTSTRKSPSFCQQGEKTEPKKVLLELKLIADIGLIGFPNAGKSTLLSIVSQARPKIADYHFTTLSPNLGVVSHKGESFVMADIPGLIEGASKGHGLGHEFLRHIERTRMLIHVIDMSGSEGRDPYQDYKIINNELKSYSNDLGELPQIVVANKMDIDLGETNLKKFIKKVKGVKVYPCSAIIKSGIEEILDACIEMLSTLPESKPLEFEPFVYEKLREDMFEIVKADEGVYEVIGSLVNTLVKNITLDDIDSFNYFQRQLKQRGVIAKLREAGAKDKDTILMGDTEFEFLS